MILQQLSNPLFFSPIDLTTYFARIGYEGSRVPTLKTLRRLHFLHPQAIPFENLSSFTGQSVLLEEQALSQKLIEGGRGGYCFEQNLLFGQVLHQIGFQVKGLVARVRWNAPEGVMTRRSHMLLLIELAGTHYIADVGFGGTTLTAPLRLELDTAQQTPHEPFRLTESSEGYQLEAWLKGQWKALYTFNLEPQYLPDYEVMNWYTSTHPTSLFVTTLVVARTASDRRYVLRNSQLSIHFLNGEIEKQIAASPTELRSILEEVFRLNLSNIPQLDQRLEKLLATSSHHKALEDSMSDWSSGDILANGIRLHYHRTGGNKPPLVLLHGLTDSGLCWTPVAERLAETYDVIMIDARGHGLSEVPERGYGSDQHAADVVGVIEALALEKPALLGHSMGAASAATVAAKAPHLVSCIILEDPPWREKQLLEQERLTIAADWRNNVIEGRSSPRERLIASCRLEQPRWSEGEIEPWADSKQQVSPNVMDYITARNPSWQELASRITCPTLLITASPAAGAIVTSQVASEVLNLLHHGQVVHIGGAGHCIRREQFEPFMGCVRAFLEACYARRVYRAAEGGALH